VFVLTLTGLVSKKIRSSLYANLGAVQMSKIELADFPRESWRTGEKSSWLSEPEQNFRKSLQLDPANRIANHRLGMIQLERNEFSSAAMYLEYALNANPNHRGIIKNLGYCYVWLGEFKKARALLSKIPEAQDELEVYTWWWGNLGYSELSNKSSDAYPFKH
jgi:lipopolysaccharide biosynthesis regulator YciM